jgi:transglutaminase-like putative cysteine protease
VAAQLDGVVSQTADLVLSVAVASVYERGHEELAVTVDDVRLDGVEIEAEHGGRLHAFHDVPVGRLSVHYEARVIGSATPVAATPFERIRYGRPSRYCEADRLAPLARAEFSGLTGTDLLAGVSSWVGANVAYVPGSSRSIDGAVATLLAREGVCRDFAHLTAAFLRANDVPARVVSVYAPGLQPMDFHAVTEACIDDVWCVIDATCLAPRSAMIRIATGADASDTAFMTTTRGVVDLTDMSVTAVVNAALLPTDDITAAVGLA